MRWCSSTVAESALEPNLYSIFTWKVLQRPLLHCTPRLRDRAHRPGKAHLALSYPRLASCMAAHTAQSVLQTGEVICWTVCKNDSHSLWPFGPPLKCYIFVNLLPPCNMCLPSCVQWSRPWICPGVESHPGFLQKSRILKITGVPRRCIFVWTMPLVCGESRFFSCGVG